MAEKEPARGCFNRLAVIFVLLWIVAIGIAVFTRIDGNGFGFELTGSFLPFFIFFAIFSLIRRSAQSRSRSSRPTPKKPTGQTSQMPTPPKIPGKKNPSTPVKAPAPKPPPLRDPRTDAEKLELNRPIPELPPLEPEPESGEIAALESLELEDFKPPKPMSSEEMLKQAREKYLKHD